MKVGKFGGEDSAMTLNAVIVVVFLVIVIGAAVAIIWKNRDRL